MKNIWTKVWKVIKTIGLFVWGIYTVYATIEWRYNYMENWKEFNEKLTLDTCLSNIKIVCGMRGLLYNDETCLNKIEEHLNEYEAL